MRKPTKTSDRRLPWLAALAVLFVVLLVLYLSVLSPFFSAEEEKTTTSRSTIDGESGGLVNGTILLYPQVNRADMHAIRVYQKVSDAPGTYRSYAFLRDAEDADGDGDTADFIIEGYAGNTYDEEKFAYLVVDTGHTTALERLDLGTEESDVIAAYSRFGLADDQYPTYFTLELTDGRSYTVYIGNKSPDGNYYARLSGRAAVYVLYSKLDQSVMAPLTHFVTPSLTFEADHNYSYIYIRNFSIFRDSAVRDLFFGGSGDKAPDVDITLSPDIMFTYLPSYKRDLYHSTAIYGMLAPNTIYTPNDTRVDAALQKLPGLTGSEVLQLGITDRDFAEGGLLSKLLCTLYYEMPYNVTYDENEDPIVGSYIKNVLFIAPRGADGSYVVGSLSYRDGEDRTEIFYNMIARVAADNLSFCEYSLFDWIAPDMFSVSIDNVAQMEFSSARGDYLFRLIGDGSNDQVVKELYSGFTFTYKPRNTPFSVNDQGYCDDIKQFRNLYMLLLSLHYSGEIAADSGMSDSEIADYMKDDSRCILSFVMTMEDGRRITYRFYPYSERHCMVSLSGDGIPAITTFYTLNVGVRRIADATWQLMHGVEIDPNYRY